MHATPLDSLVAACARGEPAAFEEVVARFGRLVLGVSRALRLSPSDVEDVAQVTWGAFADRAATIRDAEALPAWLARTARHEALRILRLRGREVLVDEPAEVAAPHEVTRLERDEAASERASRVLAVRAAVESLPERDRQLVVFLLAFPEASYRETSEALDMPIGSIGPIRQRALRRLRDRLAAGGINGSLGDSYE